MLDEEMGLQKTGFLVYDALFCKGQKQSLGDILRFCVKMVVSMRQ